MPGFQPRYSDIPGALLAYTEYGSGPVLLMLHPNGASKKFFRGYQRFFANQFTTIAVDSRGHGESSKNEDGYSILKYAKDIIAFCRVKDIHEARVIGYSDGGNIALCLAVLAPELFPRLAAISPNYLASATKPGTLRFIKGTAAVQRFFIRLGLPARQALFRTMLMLEDIGLSEQDLKGIRTQLAVLYAERDMFYEDHFLKMGKLIPGVQLKKISGASHISIFFKKETRDFLLEFFGG